MASSIRKAQKKRYLYLLMDGISIGYFCLVAILLMSQVCLAEISTAPPLVERPPAPVIQVPPVVTNADVPISPVTRLLQMGKKAIKEYRYTNPRNNNAEYYLSQVLQQDKKHPKALKMLAQIIDGYQKMAAKQLRAEDINLEKTATYLQKSQRLINQYHIRSLTKRQRTLEARRVEIQESHTLHENQPIIIPVEPKMVSIPAGSFKMGCISRKGCDNNEKPVHTVQITAFEMSQTEVTFEQWDVCVQAGSCRALSDNGWGRGNRPVIFASWNDAQTYAHWISQATGKNYRLPSEAEWEYAARADASTAYSSGQCIHTDQANYDGNSGWGWLKNCGKTGKFHNKTTLVAQFPGNKFSLQDMQGNVWEWVQDCYHKTYQGAPADGKAWESHCDQSSGSIFRILRGGAWSVGAILLRNAARYSQSPQFSAHNAGFRLVRGHASAF